MSLRSALAEINSHATEALRILILQVFLAPAAYVLPRSWALAAARLLSLPLLLFPSPGFTTFRRMQRMFGGNPYRSFQLAWGWIAGPFCDFVILKRVKFGREDVSRWKIIESNSEEVARLRETGRSFIVATAHFERSALLGVTCPQITPGIYVQVAHTTPRRLNSPYDLRLRIQYGALLDALSKAWGRPVEFAFTNAGQAPARMLYERLSKPGSVVNIHLDATWPERATGSFSRPFAGKKERSFATGAVQLAKLCRCPLVSCVYWRDDSGAIHLQWGSPILQVDDEIETMNRLIDTMETAIGERPTHYALDVGRDRRWNAVNRCWENAAV